MRDEVQAAGVRGTLRANPYVGLTPFTEEEAAFFFGREQERRIVATNLIASRLTVVYGPSGVGKSSVLLAGVAHDLRRAAARDIAAGRVPESIVVVFRTWHDDPVVALGETVAATVAETLGKLAPEPVPCGPHLDTLFAEWDERLRELAGRVERESGLRQPRWTDLLLILDQFEEYFLYQPDDDGRRGFSHELARVLNRRDVRANVIVSLREDAFTLLDRLEGEVPRIFANTIRIEHLDRDAAAEAIRGPLARAAELRGREKTVVDVEDVLVDEVLAQVGRGSVVLGRSDTGVAADAGNRELAVETPFLQLVMERLWEEERASGSHVIRLETLHRLGGAEQIVRGHLQNALAGFDEEQRDAAARILGRLVTPSGTKIALFAEDLSAVEGLDLAVVTAVLEELARWRIVRAVASPDGGAERFEIFHDVLAPAILEWRATIAHQRAREEARAYTRERRRTRVLAGLVVTQLVTLLAFGLTLMLLARK